MNVSRESIDGAIALVPAPVLVANDGGRVFGLNDEARELLGLRESPADPERLTLAVLLPGFVPPKADEGTRVVELELRRPDGTTVPVRVRTRRQEAGHDSLIVMTFEVRTVELVAALRAETNRWILEEVGQLAGIGIFDWEIENDQAAWSDDLFRMFGYEPGAFSPSFERFLEFVHPEDRALAGVRVKRFLHGTAPVEYSGRAVRADGSEFRIEVRGKIVRDGSGRATRLYGVIADATATRGAELDRARLEALMRGAFDGIVLTNTAGEIQEFNPAAEVIYGRDRNEIIGRTVAEVLPADEALEVALIAKQIAAGESDDLVFETKRVLPDGNHRQISVSFAAAKDRAGQLVGIAGTIRDLSATDGTATVPERDPLTGLPAGNSFMEMSADQLGGEGGALFHFNLDNLRLINEAHGYQVGDWVLRGVAQTLARECGEQPPIGRIGGDEFGILILGISRDEAEVKAARFLRLIRGYVEPVGNSTVTVTASIGVVTWVDGDSFTVRELNGKADQALDRAKQGGKDTWVIAEPGWPCQNHGAPSSRTWGERIRKMLAGESFDLHLQPIIDLESRAVVSYEALLRITEGGQVESPGPWLEAAERLGMIKSIDRAVVRRAVEMLEAHPDLSLSANISGGSIGDDQLLEILAEAARHHRFDPSGLVIELTETTTATDNRRIHRFATSLREVGCGIAIDDFGAGYGSYDYLRHVPADFVKIDGQFVRGETNVDEVVVASLVGLAQGLNKKTIAECIESEQVLERMARAGIDQAQGFHIGRPAPAGQVLNGAS